MENIQIRETVFAAFIGMTTTGAYENVKSRDLLFHKG